MNHIRQSGETCYPTAVAMLSDQPVQQVIQTLLKGTSYATWGQMLSESLHHTQDEIDHTAQIVHQNAQSILPWISPKSLKVSYWEPRVSLAPLVLNGRGTISVRTMAAGHVVAFEKGMVYDSAMRSPVPWELWESMHDMMGAKIVNLTVDPESVRHEKRKKLKKLKAKSVDIRIPKIGEEEQHGRRCQDRV
jgi:hypothetical protein